MVRPPKGATVLHKPLNPGTSTPSPLTRGVGRFVANPDFENGSPQCTFLFLYLNFNKRLQFPRSDSGASLKTRKGHCANPRGRRETQRAQTSLAGAGTWEFKNLNLP